MNVALLLLALQGSVGPATPAAPDAADTLRLRPDSAAMATAYADAETRELVRLARGHRGFLDASVFRYRATARQRVSVGVRALRRDRLIFRREVAAVVDWRRDGPSRVEVKGAREVVPIAIPGVEVPDDLESWARDFVPEPGDDRLFIAPQEGGFAWHPLVEGGEALYRYAIGDTTVVRLPDGREVRLVELRVTPRERDIRRVTGSFWIELDDHAIVQAVFRPSREFDLERDLAEIDPGEEDELDEVPGFLKPIRFDVRYVTVEYGLWEMRWWMPRLLAFDGYLQMGPARFPITLEARYDDYTVEADRYGLPELPPLIRELAGDPYGRARPYTYGIDVALADTASLLESPLLGASIYDAGEALISEGELRELGDRLGSIPAPPWEAGRPRVRAPWQLGTGLLRYNRVEGLSAGARVDWDLARARLDLTGRFGVASVEPDVELGVEVPGLRRTWRLAGYHRLAAADPSLRPFGLANSFNALVFGRDDGTYFRASGAELRLRPAPGEARYDVRLYAERQAAAHRNTDFSLRQLGDDGVVFRPNIDAADADQVGIAARVGAERGLDPTGFRWGAWVDLTAEAGTYAFVRPGLTVRAAAPLPGSLVGGVELAGGTTLGGDPGDAAPVQSHWFLGGPATLRGFPGGALDGEEYARARVELANDFPAARLAVFSDAGWAGPSFDAYDPDRLHVSVGAGASFLDGLLRLDLARAVQPVEGWRLEMYIDALF